jgi:hypothetical protein
MVDNKPASCLISVSFPEGRRERASAATFCSPQMYSYWTPYSSKSKPWRKTWL